MSIRSTILLLIFLAFVSRSQAVWAQKKKSKQPVDTTAPCVLNICVRGAWVGAVAELPSIGTVDLAPYRASFASAMPIDYLYRFEFQDTGQLLIRINSDMVAGFQRMSVAKNTKVLHIPVQRGERWLWFESAQPSINRLYRGRYRFYSQQEFSAEYPNAFRQLQQDGFNRIFTNLPLNTNPTQPPRKTSERWPVGY